MAKYPRSFYRGWEVSVHIFCILPFLNLYTISGEALFKTITELIRQQYSLLMMVSQLSFGQESFYE